MSESSPAAASNVSATEVAQFNALAARWWDRHGPMRPLHAMNPARIGWILSHTARRFASAEATCGCWMSAAAPALPPRRSGTAGFRCLLGVDAADDVIEAGSGARG